MPKKPKSGCHSKGIEVFLHMELVDSLHHFEHNQVQQSPY